MNKVVQALVLILQHLVKNFSNYCLFIGLVCILYFIKITYGVPTTILSVGIVAVITSLVIELNKNKKTTRNSGW